MKWRAQSGRLPDELFFRNGKIENKVIGPRSLKAWR